MENTSSKNQISERDIFYFRQRYKNRVFQAVVAYFADQAERFGLTKREIATRLQKDPAQITRWLSGPGNWTLDTISDMLLAMDAEMGANIVAFDEDDAINQTTRVVDAGKTVFFVGVNTGTTGPKYSHG